MIVYCLENEFISPAVRYTLEFILDSIGFFFQWAAESDPLEKNSLTISYGKSSKTNAEKASIYLPCILAPKSLHKQEIQWQEAIIDGNKIPVIGSDKSDKINKSNINFDLIASIYFHLARIEEREFKHPDQVDLNAERAILFKYGEFKSPVVDILLNWFGNIIEETMTDAGIPGIKKAAFPNGEQFGLAFTHDVDITRFINPFKRSCSRFLSIFGNVRKSKYEVIKQAEKDIWAFNSLLNYYHQKKLRTTFNFIAKRLEGKSFRYNIGSGKFNKLFLRLKKEGHEIGLHSSRYAFDYPKRYFNEKIKLEQAANTPINGMRQHYLRCLFPQVWRVAGSLNMNYDSSLAYRRKIGFRAGTTKPFPCFDYEKQAAYSCYEFSTPFFEESLPNEGLNKENSLDAITSLIKTVKQYSGVLTVLWHPSNMYRLDHLKKTWDGLLNLLEREDTFNAPLVDQYKWQEQRRYIHLQPVFFSKKEIRFILSIPKNTETLTIEVPKYINSFEIENCRYQFNKSKNRIHFKPGPNCRKIDIRAVY